MRECLNDWVGVRVGMTSEPIFNPPCWCSLWVCISNMLLMDEVCCFGNKMKNFSGNWSLYLSKICFREWEP